LRVDFSHPEKVCQLSQDKLELELTLTERQEFIKTLEDQLQAKQKECIQLRAFNLRAESKEKSQKPTNMSLVDDKTRPVQHLHQPIDLSVLDLASVSRKIQELKKTLGESLTNLESNN
jgi:hypothetical protein